MKMPECFYNRIEKQWRCPVPIDPKSMVRIDFGGGLFGFMMADATMLEKIQQLVKALEAGSYNGPLVPGRKLNIIPMDQWPVPKDKKKPVCECGSAKVGSPMHSDWCPMYEEASDED